MYNPIINTREIEKLNSNLESINNTLVRIAVELESRGAQQ